ncbi:hypothetical protein PV08_04999 [Exophiala spinifera]|uniref:DUF7708 domain-containing protein n=1 Tax=Exophiala spinifera TaxID=91928 RepID=A0A0D2C2C9_9EURO|nr:uncharacterized protein PV08_04999 [Exophiala spinifera]KIW17804.1 hypothetical protein PV08_04999 [Exophiala spinifera]
MDWKSYYLPDGKDEGVATSDLQPDPAEEAFENATAILSSIPSTIDGNVDILKGHHTIQDIFFLVLQAQNAYDNSRSRGKAWQWLSALSSRLHYYAPVMDALSQFHSGYASLAWGTVKFLLMVSRNHEEQIATFSYGLSRIADHLPRHGLILKLYPTHQIKRGVSFLYAKIIEFLMSALVWYQEGRLKRIYHAVTQPVDVRYKGLFDEINECSRCVDRWAVVASQAELRDVHNTQSDILTISERHYDLTQRNTSQLDDIRADIHQILLTVMPPVAEAESRRGLHSAALLNTKQVVTTTQLVQMIGQVSGGPLKDPLQVLHQASLLYVRRQAVRGASLLPEAFWSSPQLQTWASAPSSSVVFCHSSVASRFKLKDFSVNLVQTLTRLDKPTLWIFAHRNPTDGTRPIHNMYSLILQAIKLCERFGKTETWLRAMSRITTETSQDECVDILFEILSKLPPVYIVFEINSIDAASCGPDPWWPCLVSSFLRQLPKVKAVKVLFSSYGRTSPTCQLKGHDIVSDGCLIQVDCKKRGRLPPRRQDQVVLSPRKAMRAESGCSSRFKASRTVA